MYRRYSRMPLSVIILILALALCPGAVAAQDDEMAMDDPNEVPTLSGSVDMAQAVRHALLVNPRMDSASSEIDAYEAARYGAIADFLPSVSATYNYTKLDHPKPDRDAPRFTISSLTGDASGYQSDDDVYTASLQVTQNLFTGFQLLSSYQKAALQEVQAEANKEADQVGLILLVQENFLNLLAAREHVRSAQDSVTRLESQLQVTKAFHEVGLRPRLDVLQAEVDLADAEDTLLQAQNLVDTQEARLDTLLLVGRSGNVDYEGELAYIPFTMSLDQCLEEAADRPDLRAMRQAVKIAGKDVNIAASGFFPLVSAEFNWSSTGNTWDVRGQEYDRTEFSEWSAGVTMQWQIFDFGRTYFDVRQAQHVERQFRADERTQYQEVVYEVTARVLSLDEAEKRIKVAQKGLEQAKEAYRMAVARYQAQVGTNNDVLDAQAQLTRAEAQHTSAMADYLVALAQMYASLGRQNPTLLAAE